MTDSVPPDLDGDNVAVLGESMGGRFAIIATALEPRLKAAIGVSTGPYGLQGDDDASVRFVKSIEPAGYLSSLPPRKLIMLPLHRRHYHTGCERQTTV